MLNTEIGKTGEVIVEGHAIGRLDGFTFAPDAAEAGSDAKALQAAAQKALAGEIDARAEKLSNAPDDQFVLASDGTMRWTGDAVAKLVGADDVLHPRIRIIADDRLAGASRDAVQTRLDLWMKTHIEKLLGPLFELSKAEDVTGIARGIAFQLIEGLGVLERSKIASEVKDLDQTSRATLRKYGVRFGAYHIYLPALLKPAARAIASLLWAHKHDNIDLSALSGAQQLAGSGRTSFPVDKALDREAYRVLGYRQCGERAVRVDILERLADLIRPALAWREGSSGEKPAGAFDGRGFVVTQAMTSLTGSAGEDFASILRALGYRMDRRPAPPPAAVPEVKAEPKAASSDASDVAPASDDTTSGEIGEVDNEAAIAVEAVTTSEAVEPAVAANEEIAPVEFAAAASIATAEAPEAEPAVVEAPAAEQPAPEANDNVVVESQPQQADGEVVDSSVAPVAETSATTAPEGQVDAAAVPAEPQMVEVWRPGGRSDERRPHHDRNRHRRPNRPQDGAPSASAEGEQPNRERHGQGRRDRKDFSRFKRPDADATQTRADGAPAREQGEGKGRPPREQFHGKGRDKGRFQRPQKGGRDGRQDGGPSHRPFASSAPPRERDRPIDPNSPFAKLAALKEQLAANRKD